MGLYINCPILTHEEFVATYGTPLSAPPTSYTNGPDIAVVLVHNPEFTALAIATDNELLAEYSSPVDPRPREWYYIPMDVLTPPLIGFDVKDYLR